jgi:hypothetical protein
MEQLVLEMSFLVLVDSLDRTLKTKRVGWGSRPLFYSLLSPTDYTTPHKSPYCSRTALTMIHCFYKLGNLIPKAKSSGGFFHQITK